MVSHQFLPALTSHHQKSTCLYLRRRQWQPTPVLSPGKPISYQRSNCEHPLDHRKSKRIPEKHLILLHWLCQSLWLCGSQQTGKFFKRWGYQTTLPVFWETCMQVKKQHLELDMEQWTGSKLGKGLHQGCIMPPFLFNYMQSTSCNIPVWMKHKLESKFLGEISITSDMQMTPPLWQKVKRTEEPLDEGERGEWKIWLKTQHSKN